MNCPHKNECGAYTPNSITCNMGGSTYCGIYRNLTSARASTSNKGAYDMLKNKKIMMVFAIVVVGTLFGGILAVSAASGWILGQEATPAPGASFYESAYAKATSEQKEELDKIIADEGIGLPGEWIRPVLIAVGDLPKDQPRLTAKQAGEIYDRIGRDERALEREFNKIAGAPDFVGGSGIVRSIYYLNDDRSQVIFLMLGDAELYTVNDDGIYNIRLPLGSQKLPVDPGPSTAPQGTPTTLPTLPSPTEMPMPSPARAKQWRP